jgi:hypothetical protein
MLYHYAMLTADQLRRVTALERELGTTLVAFQSQDVPFAKLSPDQMKRIQELEAETGLSLLAVAH